MLTIAGIFLSVLLYILANVGVSTYLNELYVEAESCSPYGVLLSGSIDKRIIDDLRVKYGKYPISKYMMPITSYEYSYSLNEFGIAMQPIIVGVSENAFSGLVYSTQSMNGMFMSEIVSGRDISYNDIANRSRVVVISEFARDVLFGGKEVIGETIELSLTGDSNDKESFIVIGIYRNSLDEKKALGQFDYLKKDVITSINVQVNCFVPYSVYYDYTQLIDGSVYNLIINTGDNCLLKEEIEEYYQNVNGIEVDYYEKKIDIIETINKDIIDMVRIIMVVLMSISGMNLFNCMMFSIKERIGEIGVRKAVGANSINIFVQFVFEGIINALMGVLLAVVISIISTVALSFYIDNFTITNIAIYYPTYLIAEVICYSVLIGVLFSVIPAIIASKTSVVNAIRFD